MHNRQKQSVKVIWAVITLSSMLLYLPVNRLISGGYNLQNDFDKLIPLIPAFVVPYLLTIPVWMVTVFYANFKANQRAARNLNLQIITAAVVSTIIYILIPTFVERPLLANNDIFSQILNLVYANDRAYNAAPSGHTFYTLICLFFLAKQLPNKRIIWITGCLIILLSTVLIKQHNILDIFLGIIFAVLIHLAFSKRHIKNKVDKN